ncbi:MAG: beta-ketoacyl-[acyl-carrier-protein] synthase family protein [bacterium]
MVKRVVITGMGTVTPMGIGVPAFWQGLCEGRSTVQKIDLFDPSAFRSQVAAIVPDFNPKELGLTDEEIGRMDRYIQFAVIAADEAVRNSGLNLTQEDRSLIGTCINSAIGGTARMEQNWREATKDGACPPDWRAVDKNLYLYASPYAITSEIAQRFTLHGPAIGISTGCTTGLDSAGYAFELIRSGEAVVMVTGSSEAPICPITLAAFDKIGACSTSWNHDPKRASRPFDAKRDGFVLGEGSGIIIMEEYEHARARGAHILAEIISFSSNCNAFHMTGLKPDGIETAYSIKKCLTDPGLSPDSVQYINSHGSATQQNDSHETGAYKNVFKDAAYKIPISSIKSCIGHALGGVGSIEIIASVLSLMYDVIPPTINIEFSDPECDLDYVPHKARQAEVHTVISNASGFSGLHSCISLTEIAA